MVLAYLLMGFAESLWMLGLARFMTGIMGANVSVAMAYVTDVTPIEDRAKSMGLGRRCDQHRLHYRPGFRRPAQRRGRRLGLLTAARYSVPPRSAAVFSWPRFSCSESLTPEQRAQSAQAREDQPGGLQAIRMVLRRPIVTRLIIVGFMIYYAMGFFETIMPLWSESAFRLGPARYRSVFYVSRPRGCDHAGLPRRPARASLR